MKNSIIKSKIKTIFIGFIFLALLLSPLAINLKGGFNVLDSNKKEKNIDIINSRESLKTADSWNIPPISINGISGWDGAASNNWCNGSGTFNDPYIIENVTINAGGTQSCIAVSNSNVYFIIRNCTLYGASSFNDAGIYLSNVKNGLILENNCSFNYHGIYGLQCENNTIQGNYCHNNSYYGIYLRFSAMNNTIIENYCYNNYYYGLLLDGFSGAPCFDNNITDNIFNNNGWFGVYLESANTTTFCENIIRYNGFRGATYEGLRMQRCNQSLIQDNIFQNNSYYGISMDLGCFDNNITRNAFIDNPAGGIVLADAEERNLIYFNYFDNPSASFEARDYGNNNQWDNGIIGNYWQDYGGVDGNGDGIGDSSYTDIGGDAPADQDSYPLFESPMHNGTRIQIDGRGIASRSWAELKLLKWWVTGSGTKIDPYVIENLNVDAAITFSCIDIIYSSDYFIIRDCILNNTGPDPYSGLFMSWVENGIVSRNKMINSNFGNGIRLQLCKNMTISKNTIKDNANDGIQCDRTNNTLIQENYLENNRVSIYVYQDSHNITVKDNIANLSTLSGMYVQTDSTDNSIEFNEFIYAKGAGNSYGIVISTNTHRNNFSNNIILNNTHGIYMGSNCDNNSFWNNRIENSSTIGVWIKNITTGCENNLFYNNSFYNPGVNAYDNGTVTLWNLGNLGNYWHDYFSAQGGVDIAPEDGIGDTPYNITGTQNSQDLNPVWDDGDDNGPTINITSPGNNTEFTNPPTVQLSFYDYYSVNATWYKYVGFSGNISLIGNFLIINQTIWDLIGEGKTLTIRFFANDSSSHLTYKDLIIRKYDPSVSTNDKDGAPINENVLILIVIGIVCSGAVSAGVLIRKKKASGKQSTLSTRKKTLPPSTIKPKKPITPKADIKGKKPKKSDIAAPSAAALTARELEELKETEEEVGVEKKQYICVVHKGPIDADNVYLCPDCHTLYCTKCARVLKEKEEKCWSCGNEMKISAEEKIDPKTQKRILALEEKRDSLKSTVKMLDENFFSGAISEEEYTKMKDSLTKKVAAIIKELDQLKE